MRKQAKPVSGNVTSRRAGNMRPNNLQTQFHQTGQGMNDTFVVDNNTNSNSRQNITTPPSKRSIPISTRANVRSPAVSKKAKQKWELIERKVSGCVCYFHLAYRKFQWNLSKKDTIGCGKMCPLHADFFNESLTRISSVHSLEQCLL